MFIGVLTYNQPVWIKTAAASAKAATMSQLSTREHKKRHHVRKLAADFQKAATESMQAQTEKRPGGPTGETPPAKEARGDAPNSGEL